jgi:hypothetical protein
VIAAVQRVRRQRGRVTAGDDRLETDVYAVKRLLYRLGHAERSGRFALSLDQFVAACARVMPWGPVPARGGQERERFFRRHRASVQRWLSWLDDAGVIKVAPEKDSKGYWWRTVIELRGRLEVDFDALQAARTRMNGWAGRDRRRRAKACPPRRSLAAIRRKASKPQRRTWAALGRSRVRRVHEQRRRAAVEEAIAEATERCLFIEKDLGHPYGAPPSEADNTLSSKALTGCEAASGSVFDTASSSRFTLESVDALSNLDGRACTRSAQAATASKTHRERQSTERTGAPASGRVPEPSLQTIERHVAQRREQTRWGEELAVRQARRAAERVWSWPVGRPVALGVLAEAWALARHGERRVAESWGRVGAGPLGRVTARQAAVAIELYEAFAAQRPPGWPDTGPAALLVLAARGRAATLRGDLATLLILAKGMRAVALHADPERVARARRRALKRAMPKNVRFAFRTVARAPTADWPEPAEHGRRRIRDAALLAGFHPGVEPDVLDALDRPVDADERLPSSDGPDGYKARYLAWEARQRAARRVLEQRGYDPTTAAQWSADGMTDRAHRYLAELEHGRWTLPERFEEGRRQ